jgi:hypothetical protein
LNEELRMLREGFFICNLGFLFHETSPEDDPLGSKRCALNQKLISVSRTLNRQENRISGEENNWWRACHHLQ